MKLNTSARREAALRKVATVYSDRDPLDLDLNFLIGFFATSEYQLSIPSYRDSALFEVLRNLADNDARSKLPGTEHR